jgi:hypothetical protein
VVLLFAGAACSSGSGGAAAPGATEVSPATTAAASSTAEALCAARPDGTDGALAEPDLVEASGVVASRSQPGVLWLHNDSGGGAELFAVGLDGTDRGRVEVVDVDAVDWEDIALLAGTGGVPDRLVIADIGNNPGSRSRRSRPVRLHLVDEPTAPGPGASGSTGSVSAVDLTYADGPRDAEALLADPVTGDGLVVSKQWDGTGAGVYVVPAATFSVAAPEPVTMARAATVGVTEGSLVTGGDITADGRAVVLRTYSAVLVWERDPTVTVAETLGAAPTCTVAVDEPQGEAVAVLADGSGLVTVSEGEAAPVRVRRAS